MRLIRSFSAGNDIYNWCRHNLQNKMAAPAVHRLKIAHVTISPSAQRVKVVHRDVREG